MQYLNENEIHYRIHTIREQIQNDKLAALASQVKPAIAEAKPIRQKVGIMLMRMGMRLAGYTL